MSNLNLTRFIKLFVLLYLVASCSKHYAPAPPTEASSTPAARANVVATSAKATAAIILSWDAVVNADSYNIYCSATNPVDKNGTKYTNVTSPYTVTGLRGGTTYYCAVSTIIDEIEGDLSTQVSSAPPFLNLTTGQSASIVVGQTDFTSFSANTTASTLTTPWGNPSVYLGQLFLPDYGNSRILIYNSIPTVNGASANLVVGQTNLTSSSTGTSTSQIFYPYGAAAGNGVFAMADTGNNRIILFSPIPTTNGAAASVVLGQADFTSSAADCAERRMSTPASVFIGAGKLLVADQNNHRVLIWNSIPTSTTSPDLVLGQSDLTTCNANSGGISASSLSSPNDMWTDGTKLLVMDSNNNRILIWDTFPTANKQAADHVLGQATFVGNSSGTTASTLSTGGFANVSSNGTQIFVADYGNNRALIWNSFPTTNGVAADVVLGQAAFTTNTGGTTASTMGSPAGITNYGSQLFISEYGNQRVLIFNSN